MSAAAMARRWVFESVRQSVDLSAQKRAEQMGACSDLVLAGWLALTTAASSVGRVADN